jgi:hypothetical protein
MDLTMVLGLLLPLFLSLPLSAKPTRGNKAEESGSGPRARKAREAETLFTPVN